jgi:hypothetical protein
MDFYIQDVDRYTILSMLKEEQKMRYSKEIQELYTRQYYNKENNPNYEIINIEREIQKFILERFGYNSTNNSLEEYWKIPSTYWNDEEVKNSIFYMKLNIFSYSDIKEGDELKDSELINYETNELTKLSQLHTVIKPLILLVGSMT